MPESLPVTFRNPDGEQLVGILHLPEDRTVSRPCIVLLSPGVKMRVAPHRMYNKMADRYVRDGFPVLRFDFTGLGDAEGEIDMDMLSHVYNSIQLGRFSGDTRAALDWLERDYGFTKFIVGGLCGGAITGLLASQSDPRIVALLALGIPAILDLGEAQQGAHLTKGELEQLGRGYLGKILDPQSWLRFLSFRSDYRVIFKSLRRLFERRIRAGAEVPTPVPRVEQPADNTNPRFAPAMFSMLENGRPMLHIFSGSDRLVWEFKEKFQDRHSERLSLYPDLVEIHVIDKANHILAHPDWFGEMLSVSSAWLKRFV